MTADLFNLNLEKVKYGDTFRVSERDGVFKLEKTEALTVHLPENVAFVLKIYAIILDETLEGMILQKLEDIAENLSDGGVLGEEVEATHKKLFVEKEPEKAPA